jgi:hypothetical protein
MIPPKEYFEQCDELAVGAQQVGAVFYRFIHRNCLYDMLNEGIFEKPESDLLEELEAKSERVNQLEGEVEDTESRLIDANEKIENLEAEIAKLKEKEE